MGAEETKIFEEHEVQFIADNAKSDETAANAEQYDSEQELSNLKQDLLQLYEKKAQKRKYEEQLKPVLQAIDGLTDFSDVSQKQKLILLVQQTLGKTRYSFAFQRSIEDIFDAYNREVGDAVTEYRKSLQNVVFEKGEGIGIDKKTIQALPNNEKALLWGIVKGAYGPMLYDDQGQELSRDKLSKEQKKEIKKLIAVVQGVNLSSFFEAINAYTTNGATGIEAMRSTFGTADEKTIMDAWKKDGVVGKNYAQLQGYKELKRVEQRRLAKLTIILLQATDTQASANSAPVKSLLTHLQASTQQVAIDNKLGGKKPQYNERAQYVEVYQTAKQIEQKEGEIDDARAGSILDILIADQDRDVGIDEEVYAHHDQGYRAKKSWIYQLFHLKHIGDIRAENKDIKQYNKTIKQKRGEAAEKQKEAGAGIYFEGQLQRSLNIARGIIMKKDGCTEVQANTKILQNLVGLVKVHYEQLAGDQAQVGENANIRAALIQYEHGSATDILTQVFLKYPQTFGYLRGFLSSSEASPVDIFLDGPLYGKQTLHAAKQQTEKVENLDNIGVPEALLAKLDEQYGKLSAILDRKITEAEQNGADVATITALKAQQEDLQHNWGARKISMARNALTVIASTINNAQGLGLASGVTAHLDNEWLQSISLGAGLFQGVGADSVAGTSLGVSLTFAGNKKIGGGTLMYSVGAGTGANWNALGFLQGFDIGASLGYEWTINEKTLASNLDPKSKKYLGAAFSASLLHGGFGPHMWYRGDRLAGLQEAEQKLLAPTQSLIDELLSKNCLQQAQKEKKTLQMYIYEQLLAKRQGSGDSKKEKKKSSLFGKTTEATLENSARNLAVGLMTYYTNPEFSTLSTNPQQRAYVAESIARHHLLHWATEHLEDLKQGLGSLHMSSFDLGVQIVASGPAPLKIIGGTFTWYKDGYLSEDYASREQVEQVKEKGLGARELPGSFGSAIDLYNTLLDAHDGTFMEDMKLTATTVEHNSKSYPAVLIPTALFDYLRNHDGGVVIHKLEMAYMKKDDKGIYVSPDIPSNLITVATSGKNEYQLVLGDVGGVGRAKQEETNGSKALFTQFDQIGNAVRDDAGGFAERDAAVQEASREKYEVQLEEKLKAFMQTVNIKTPGFFTKPTEVPTISLSSFSTTGNPDGTVKLPIDPTMKFFGDAHKKFITTDGTGTYLEIPLSGTIQVTKSIDPNETQPWKLDFVPSALPVQGLSFTYGEAKDAFTKSEDIASEGFNLEAVQPELIDYLKSREGAEATLKWRYKDVQRTSNQDHERFYKLIQNKDFAGAASIAKEYMTASGLVFDASERGKANLYTVYAELSRVDMTEFKDVENMSEAKGFAREQLTALVSTGRVTEADEQTLIHIIDDVFDGTTPVTDFMSHQKEIERILKVRYIVDYNRNKNWDDPAYKLTYLLAPASVVDKTRTKALLARLKNESIYKDVTVRNDFMQKRDQIFTSMDQAETIANIGTVKKNYYGLVVGYGAGVIDEKIIAHPPVMDFPGSVIPYDKKNPIERKHVQYFVDNTKEKEPEYLIQDMQGMIDYLELQLKRTDLTKKCREELADAKAFFESKKNDINEIASLWQTGAFLDGKLPVGIKSVTKEFSQTKYPKCVNDMIIAGPTKIYPNIETESKATVELNQVGAMKIEPYTFGKAHVTTGVVAHRMSKDTRTVNILTSHGNLERTYQTVEVESKTEIKDLDEYLGGLTPEQRQDFLDKLGQPIQPGIELDLGLGQGLQTYDGWDIGNNIWVVQDNSGSLPTMRLVNIVDNTIINSSVLSNREQSFIVKSNARTAQNLRQYFTKKIVNPIHPASPEDRGYPAQPVPVDASGDQGNTFDGSGVDVPNTGEIIGDDFTPLENQEQYLTSESVYGYTYTLGNTRDGSTVLRIKASPSPVETVALPIQNLDKINEQIANQVITIDGKQVFLDAFSKKLTLMPLEVEIGSITYTAIKEMTSSNTMNPTWVEVSPSQVGGTGDTKINTIAYTDSKNNVCIIVNNTVYRQNATDPNNVTYEKIN